MRDVSHPRAGPAGLARVTLWAAITVLALGGAVFSGCDIGGGDDDEPAATTPATTQTTGPTGPSGEQDDGGGTGGTGGETGGSVGGADPTPEDTGPTVPESGGVGADEYDPEADSPQNDLPPPPGGPQEKFEQFCDENPGACE